ncbi:M20/M25/M40 family metallo-hydrolase [Streptomyces sp. NPDC085900]|uniref:M20/M25/M40 family metallo-hydrolase n=1 Tax=Streptomyces sp. NPDC085900 TaxID=3365737 RepID=UPI0037D1824F
MTAETVELAQELIRRPSRGGIDDHGPVLAVLDDWLGERELPRRRLRDDSGRTVALLVEIAGGRPGPWWTLDACVDTAPYGDESAWSFPPDAGDVVDGWLRGRGAADSKLAAALFCRIAAEVRERAGALRGGLAVLLDADEHTGRFGGARAYLADPAAVRPAGVMIGYPGPDEVVVGGRGLWRATLAVHAKTGHSGARRTAPGAVSRAALLVRLLEEAELPDTEGEFPLPPRLTVTFCHGGEGFSVVPGRCEVGVDIRTTPGFGAQDAEAVAAPRSPSWTRGCPDPCRPGSRRWRPGRRTGWPRTASPPPRCWRPPPARGSPCGRRPPGHRTSATCWRPRASRPPRASACTTRDCTAWTSGPACRTSPRSTPRTAVRSSTC